MSFLIDLILLALWGFLVFWSMKRGFFATALALGAWIVSIALAQFLAAALARPLYEAVGANAARALIASNLDSAVQSGQAAQYARHVIEDLPEALKQLANMSGISIAALVENLQGQAFNSASAAELLEQAIVAPIAIAVCRLGLNIVLFIVLLAVTRLITGQVAKLRKLPVLKQADALLGAALGLAKGALLVFVITLALRAAAALGMGGDPFAGAVEDAKLVQLFAFKFT